VTTSFSAHQRDRRELDGVEDFLDELSGDLTLSQEVFDKVRGMEGKLEYQIKKLIGLADAEEKRGREVIDDAEEGGSPLLLYREAGTNDRSSIVQAKPCCFRIRIVEQEDFICSACTR
jgi:hypothetical protein